MCLQLAYLDAITLPLPLPLLPDFWLKQVVVVVIEKPPCLQCHCSYIVQMVYNTATYYLSGFSPFLFQLRFLLSLQTGEEVCRGLLIFTMITDIFIITNITRFLIFLYYTILKAHLHCLFLNLNHHHCLPSLAHCSLSYQVLHLGCTGHIHFPVHLDHLRFVY